MKIKHLPVEIPKDDPFKHCKLGRKKYGEILTSIIGAYTDGFVLAIDSKWGTGKTTFVEMWKQQLENDSYKTLYFNSWINDFDSDPLVAILAELKTLNPKKDDKTFKAVLSKGAVITQKILPTLVKALAERYLDTKVLTDSIEKITESAVDILKDEVNEYAKKKKGLTEFKTELSAYIKENTDGKPLVFIIDELDRCRPSYAVEVLEQIKHFFNVVGIVFVLAIDKVQLGNAIRGFYGSDRIDSNEYLRRFIDLEYTIPEPGTGTFGKYLYDYYQFNDFFYSNERKFHQEFQNDKESFLKVSNLLFENDRITLRQQEKIFAHARLVLNMFNSDQYVYPAIYFLLIYLRDIHAAFYINIKSKNLSIDSLIKELRKIFPDEIDNYDLNFYVDLEGRFIKYYENYVHGEYKETKLIARNDETGKYYLLVQSGFGADANPKLLGVLESLNIRSSNLNYLLERIDLLKDFSEH